MRKFVQFVMLLLLGFSHPVFAQFEFGIITGQDCQSSACEIVFDNTYSEAPVVFLMSSIEQSNLANDRPALAVVQSVSTTSAFVRQDNVFSGSNLDMDPIYYFVAEPGQWAPDPAQPDKIVEVGKLTASRYQRQGNRAGESWHSRSFNVNFNGQTPIVLAQIQPDAGRTAWVTTTVSNVNSNTFRYALEFGRQSLPAASVRSRTFGYLAAPQFTGVTADGVDFSFVLPNRSYNQGNGISGLTNSCNNNEVPLPRSFSDYGVIGKKQTRNGGDGGWLRACDLSADDHFTITLEEDATNRSHPVNETIGFFVYGTPSVELCEYFPSSLQNNNYFNGVPVSGLFSMSGNGNTVSLPSRQPLAFNSVSVAGNNSGCIYDGSTIESCSFDGSVTYPDFPPSLPSFKLGSANINCNSNNCTATPGEYQSLNISNNRRLTLSPGVYWINNINLSNGARLETSGQVYIHYRNMFINGNGVSLNANGDYENLILIGHGASSRILTTRNNLTMKALLYIDAVGGFTYTGTGFDFEGSISSQIISFNSNNNSLDAKPPRQCSTPSDNYQLSVSPATDIGLMCGGDLPTFTFTTSNNSSPISTGVTIELYRNSVGDAPYLEANVADGIGSGSGSSFTTDANGQLKLIVSSTNPSQTLLDTQYTLRAQMSADSNQVVTSSYRFLPFKFSAEDLLVVAGKEQSIETQVLACDVNNTPVVAASYSGTPTINHAVQTPSPAQGGVNGSLNFAPVFTSGENGRTTDTLTIDESGEFLVTLTDSNFDCTGLSGCPIDGNGVLTGTFTVSSRPWKIALCSVQETSNGSNTNPATTDSGFGFMAAGNDFSVTYRPVIYSNDANPDVCSLNITDNYAKDSGPLSVQYTLAYPSGGRLATVTPATVPSFDSSASELQIEHNWSEVGTLEFTTSATYLTMALDPHSQAIGRFYPAHLVMNTVSEQWDYAAGHTGFAYMSQPIGHQFSVEAQNAANIATSNYGLFADGIIVDLRYFAEQLDGSDLSTRTLATTNWNDGEWGARAFWQLPFGGNVDTARLALDFDDFSFEKLLTTPIAGNDVTDPDGPFNSANARFGLAIEDSTDTIQFKTSDSNGDTFSDDVVFPSQPEFRYGRMHLFDGGTVTGQTGLAIPLQVEFWNQNRFEVNDQDSGTLFDADDHCHQVIWRTDNAPQSDVALTGQGTVLAGSASNVQIDHNNAQADLREQVRVWLRINATAPEALTGESPVQCESDGVIPDAPWLRFNWRNNGDEDPSAVITFGIFRGNDRVIFRGEPGLIGQ